MMPKKFFTVSLLIVFPGLAQGEFISSVTQTVVSRPSSVVSYTYDPVQSRTQLTQGASTTINTTNNLNQITQSLTGTATTTYRYDARGNLNQKLSPTAPTTLTTTHNLFNQLTQITRTGTTTLTFQYDPLGRRTRKQVGSTVQQYTYDGDHLIEVRNGSGTLQRKFIYGAHLDEPIITKAKGSSLLLYY